MGARKRILAVNDCDGSNVTSPCVHENSNRLQYEYDQHTYNIT